MLSSKQKTILPKKNTIYIKKSSWIRANSSGMFHVEVKINAFVNKGQLLATISDPYGKVEHKVKAPNSGYIINVNDASIVYQGDAIFHITNTLEND